MARLPRISLVENDLMAVIWDWPNKGMGTGSAQLQNEVEKLTGRRAKPEKKVGRYGGERIKRKVYLVRI